MILYSRLNLQKTILILIVLISAIFALTNNVIAAGKNVEPAKEGDYVCVFHSSGTKCTCTQGDGSCAKMAKVCKARRMSCSGGGCSCNADESKVKEGIPKDRFGINNILNGEEKVLAPVTPPKVNIHSLPKMPAASSGVKKQIKPSRKKRAGLSAQECKHHRGSIGKNSKCKSRKSCNKGKRILACIAK